MDVPLSWLFFVVRGISPQAAVMLCVTSAKVSMFITLSYGSHDHGT